MPTIIRLAKTTGELGDVLEMRFRALGEAGRTLSRSSQFTGRVIDHLDIFPTTLNTIAYRDGQSVAGLRAVEYDPSENLLNLAFDFRESFSSLKGSSYSLDMLALTSELTGSKAVRRQLIKMALSLIAHRGVKNAFFNCPTKLLEECESLGFKRLGDPFESEILGQEICPLAIDIDEFFNRLIQGIVDKEIVRFQEVFYYTIFDPGEVMVVEGERGSTAYLIEEGEVEVIIRKGEDLVPISTIKEGHMIGEVAMVTNEPRTASLIAKTTTSCISFDRTEFMKLMYSQPHRSLDVFKIFSKRLSDSNRRLAEMNR